MGERTIWLRLHNRLAVQHTRQGTQHPCKKYPRGRAGLRARIRKVIAAGLRETLRQQRAPHLGKSPVMYLWHFLTPSQPARPSTVQLRYANIIGQKFEGRTT
ncbi:MAG: hypothetical protein AB7K36_06675 [Chloroflexota bacterium]